MEQTEQQRIEALEKREHALRADRLRFELGGALVAAQCKHDALKDAVAIMAGSCTADFDDDGRVSSLVMGENSYDSPAEAASAFLASRAYLVASDEKKPAQGPAPKAPEQLISDAYGTQRARPAVVGPAPKLTGSLEQLLASGTSASALAAAGWATPPKK